MKTRSSPVEHAKNETVHRTKYAKLTRPKTHNALVRERLFSLIDLARQNHAVLWISSPPGAGKTTLATTYVEAREAPCIWCKVDRDDADSSSLFFFLAQALCDLNGVSASQPSVLSKNISIERAFFRDFYARLPSGTIVVFDNVHELGLDTSGDILESAFEEVPEEITVIALSRTAPPARLARMELSGKICPLGWDTVRLTLDESIALAKLGGEIQDEDLTWLNSLEGWAAGVVMLRNLLSERKSLGMKFENGLTSVFRYFAGEILDRLPPESQDLLLLLSCVPGLALTEAEDLTGKQQAGKLLADLYKDSLFVERRDGNPATYHFHALFEEFLRKEADVRLTEEVRNAAAVKAGKILEQRGNIEEAAAMYQAAGAYSVLAGFLLRHAAYMLAADRGHKWREWLSWLPASFDHTDQLSYWHGVSLLAIAPFRARGLLKRAEASFAEKQDRVSQLLAIVAILESYELEWHDHTSVPQWIVKAYDLLNVVDVTTLDVDSDLRIHSRLVAASLLIPVPESFNTDSAVQRVLELIDKATNRAERLDAGISLLRYFNSTGIVNLTEHLINSLNALADDATLSPNRRLKWYSELSRLHSRSGNHQQAQNLAGNVKRIVTGFGLDSLLSDLLEARHLLGVADLTNCRRLLDHIRTLSSKAQLRELVEYHTLEAQWFVLVGDTQCAEAQLLKALELGTDSNLPNAERTRVELFLAGCYVVNEDFQAALLWCSNAATHASAHQQSIVEERRLFIDALFNRAKGDHARAIDSLRLAISLHQRRAAIAIFPEIPQLSSEICLFALEEGIETEHINNIIINDRLRSPNLLSRGWPWKISASTLGTFELRLNGKAVAGNGKAQQRPLMLLKFLVSAPDGRKSQQALTSLLWPDADDAKSALNVTIHRLRKLFGNDDIVIVSGGTVNLNLQEVWSDVHAFTNLCDQIEKLSNNAQLSSVVQLSRTLLSLYRGPFCDGEEDPWMFPVREKLRGRFISAVEKLGPLMEASKLWSTASLLYQRAIEAEPLGETSYRGLMRCAAASDDLSAAYSIYRRCRETVSIMLGRALSAETERLAVTLQLK